MKKIVSHLLMLVLLGCLVGAAGFVGAQQNNVVVPNVEGITLEVAAEILQTAGLRPRFPVSLNLSTIVAQQHPRPGLELPVGGDVVLFSDTTPRTTSDVLGTESQRQIPSVSVQPKIWTEGVSAPSETSTVTSNIATNVSVTPSRSNWQTSQVLAYPASTPGGKSTIFYQPPQRALSHYFVADTRPRFYPAWYPKRFLTVVSPQGLASTQQSDGMSITGQSQVQSQTAAQIGTQTWYPKILGYQYGSQEPGGLSQLGQQQRVGVFAVSTTPAVPVPNLFRLRQEDAAAAIKKAGLAVGKVSRMQSSQVIPGLVVQQTPRARAIVPAGTQVQLWIAD